MLSFMGLFFSPILIIVIILFCTFRIIWGYSMPLFSVIINDYINDDNSRNTILSIISLLSNIIESIILLILSGIKVTASYYLVISIFILIYIILLCLNPYINNTKQLGKK